MVHSHPRIPRIHTQVFFGTAIEATRYAPVGRGHPTYCAGDPEGIATQGTPFCRQESQSADSPSPRLASRLEVAAK